MEWRPWGYLPPSSCHSIAHQSWFFTLSRKLWNESLTPSCKFLGLPYSTHNNINPIYGKWAELSCMVKNTGILVFQSDLLKKQEHMIQYWYPSQIMALNSCPCSYHVCAALSTARHSGHHTEVHCLPRQVPSNEWTEILHNMNMIIVDG